VGQPTLDTLHDGVTAVDDLLYKALRLSEVARIARLETQLRRYLLAAWNAHSRKAVDQAVALAEQLKPTSMIARAVERGMDRWAREVLPRHIETQEKIYRLARTAGWKKANKKTSASLAYSTENMTEVIGKAEPIYSEIIPAFDLADEQAMAALGEHQTFWIGDHYDENVGRTIADTTKTTMVEAGKNRKVAGELIRERMAIALGAFSTPGGWHGSAAQYFEGLAANAATTARAFGQMRSFQDYGVTKYTWNAINDRRTCFQKDTLVLMADGSWKPICQIRIGEKAITREGRAQKVTATFINKGEKWSRVEIADEGEIECTRDHPLGKVGGGWVEASLSDGALLESLTPMGQLFAQGFSQVTNVRLFEKSQDAHDIEVEFDHSYVVWPGVPVHNCTRCAHLDGKVFTVEQGAGVMERELAAKTPDGVKRAHPFIGGSFADMEKLLSLSPSKGRGPAKESAALAGAGIAMPPAHYRCRCTVDISTEAGSWEI
jgi:hypothetical protein